jgi:DNA-binding LacI/PurR family transcriptional regulator
LTTVRQPILDVARLATEELIKRLQGLSAGDTYHCLNAKLVRRESTSPAFAPVNV